MTAPRVFEPAVSTRPSDTSHLDPRQPRKRDAEQTQPVLDKRPLLDLDRLWCDDVKTQFGRGDPLQIRGVCEEREHLVKQQGQGHRTSQDVHGGSKLRGGSYHVLVNCTACNQPLR